MSEEEGPPPDPAEAADALMGLVSGGGGGSDDKPKIDDDNDDEGGESPTHHARQLSQRSIDDIANRIALGHNKDDDGEDDGEDGEDSDATTPLAEVVDEEDEKSSNVDTSKAVAPVHHLAGFADPVVLPTRSKSDSSAAVMAGGGSGGGLAAKIMGAAGRAFFGGGGSARKKKGSSLLTEGASEADDKDGDLMDEDMPVDDVGHGEEYKGDDDQGEDVPMPDAADVGEAVKDSEEVIEIDDSDEDEGDGSDDDFAINKEIFFGGKDTGGEDQNNNKGDGSENIVVALPAAEAIMAAIGTDGAVTATATLMEENEETDEEEAAAIKIIQDEIMQEQQQQDEAEEVEEGGSQQRQAGGEKHGGNEGEGGDKDGPTEEENTTATATDDRAARDTALALNRDALYSTYEANYATLQSERDELRRELSTKDDESTKQREGYNALKEEMQKMRVQMESTNVEKESLRGLIQTEKSKNDEAQRQLTDANERTDRIERESDSLRSEIARLTKSNDEYNALLANMSTQHSKSSSEAMPLRLQVKRLEQELDVVQSHSTYLEGELSGRNDVISNLRQSHSSELRSLRGELTAAQLTLEQRERDLSSARTIAEQSSTDIDRITKKMYDNELEYNQQRQLLEGDLEHERELVALKEQRTLLAEEQRDSLLREVEELKTLAKEAAHEASRVGDDMRDRLNEGIESAVKEVREEERRKRDELEERLNSAEGARLRLEEDILNKPTPRRGRRAVPPAITDGTAGGGALLMLEEEGGGDSDPLSLTDLYTRLAQTEDDLRSANAENQKLKIFIQRIQRDVAAKTPIFHQKQVELEGALEELDVTVERLEYARQEVVDVRADNRDLEVRCGQLDREVNEMRRENVDLARQVQSLLQRRSGEDTDDMVTFTDIVSLQGQNQKLLRGHNAMSTKITELEAKIKNNPDEVELKSLRSEVGSLREEREKQSKLVAGIVHQRDLYRALVAKNDAPMVSGEDQFALADARADQLPLIEARNHDLTEEVSKLKAEVSVTKHENEALQGRLARVDAHANELTTSNERMRGDLTAAKSTVARLEIDVKHYQGKVERLESSLEGIKNENESEVKRKGQLEELLNKTQGHLEAVRGELAKKEQQYQQVSC